MLLVLPPTIVSQMQIMFEEVGGQAVYSLRRAPGGESILPRLWPTGGTPRANAGFVGRWSLKKREEDGSEGAGGERNLLKTQSFGGPRPLEPIGLPVAETAAPAGGGGGANAEAAPSQTYGPPMLRALGAEGEGIPIEQGCDFGTSLPNANFDLQRPMSAHIGGRMATRPRLPAGCGRS